MSFVFKKCYAGETEIANLFEIVPKVFTDERGFFFESFRENDFSKEAISERFLQDNVSFSKRGVLRGLHFQKHHTQAKLIQVFEGKIFDVVVDLRNDSAAFGKSFSIILDGENHNSLFVPKGFAHGFYTVSDKAVLSYKCGDYYDAAFEDGIVWNDETLGIDWNSGASFEPILSERDKNLPPFDKNKNYFDMKGNWIGNL